MAQFVSDSNRRYDKDLVYGLIIPMARVLPEQELPTADLAYASGGGRLNLGWLRW